MPLTLTEMHHKRSWARGAVTKVAMQIKIFQESRVSKLDADAVHKQLEALVKANECFELYHQAIFEQENDDEAQFMGDLREHQRNVLSHKRTLQGMINCSEAFELVDSMEEALEAMERSEGRSHCASHDTELERVVRLVQHFREARIKKGACDDPDLKSLRDQALDRLEAITQAHQASKQTPKPAEVAPIKEPQPISRGLKLQLPTFDGTIMGWRDFWDLFSSLIKRETSLDDTEKKCHLLNSMGTPDAKAAALKATAHATTYDEAVKTLKNIYEKKRVVHGQHYHEMCKPDSFGDIYEDVNRLWDRI